jgi:hypothetical protein
LERQVFHFRFDQISSATGPGSFNSLQHRREHVYQLRINYTVIVNALAKRVELNDTRDDKQLLFRPSQESLRWITSLTSTSD